MPARTPAQLLEMEAICVRMEASIMRLRGCLRALGSRPEVGGLGRGGPLVEADPLERGEGLAGAVAREGLVQGDAGDELPVSRGPAPFGEGEGAAPSGARVGELDALGDALRFPEDPLEGEVEVPGRDLVA